MSNNKKLKNSNFFRIICLIIVIIMVLGVITPLLVRGW